MVRFLAPVVFLFLLGAGAWLNAAPTPVSGEEEAGNLNAALEQETFTLVNRYREDNHLAPLIWSAEVARVARVHSRAMAAGEVDFGHEGFSDRVHLLRQTLPGVRGAGENVLMTDDPGEVARKAVDLWLNSPPHLHNIRGDYNLSGLGISENKQGVIYFTQIFLKRADTTEEVRAEPVPRLMTPFGFLSVAPVRTAP
jgi:uncharacterized protein YkwD